MAVAENNRPTDPGVDLPAGSAGIATLPLGIAIALTLTLTIYPLVLTTAAGRADHLAATLALWAMSAGYIRGVGFIPKNRGLRLLFSTGACLLTLAMAVVLIVRHGMIP